MSEAADALGYMALAGWNASQSASALPGVLNLAAASGMELADASDMVTDYLSAFGENADQAGRMADVLAYAQAHSNTTTAGLGEAFKNCAANAHAFGLDIEQTTALIGKLSDQGLKGSEAGTALTAVMRDITQKMKNGSIQIGKTSVSVQDSNGNFRDMTDILSDVEKATNGMGDAQKNAALMNTFTSDSIKALNILLNTGSGNVKEFEEALRGSKGSAEEMANTMNDNLEGDLKTFHSALEECYISIMEKLDPALRAIVKTVTGFLTAFGKLPQPIMIAVMAIAGFLAVLGPVLLVVGTLITQVQKISSAIQAFRAFRTAGGFVRVFQLALSQLRTIFSTLAGVITGTVIPAIQSLWAFLLANPIVLIIAAIAALVAGFVYLWNNCEEFRNFWLNLWDSIKSAVSNASAGVQAAFNSLINVFSSIKTFISDLFGGIGTLISDLFSGNFSKLSEDAQKLGQTLQKDFQNIITSLRGLLLNGTNALKEAFSNGLASLLDPIINWGYSVNGYFGDAFTDLFGLFEDIFNLIIDYVRDSVSIVLSIFSGDWQGALQGVQNLFSHLGENIMNVLSDLWNFISEIFMGIGAQILNAVQSAWSSFTSFLSNIWSSITSWLQNLITTVLNFINQIPSMIGYAIGYLLGIISTGLVTIWNFITQTIPTWIAQIGAWLSQLPSTIWNCLVTTYNNVVAWGSQMIQQAITTGQNFVTNAIQFFQQLPGRITAFLSSCVSRATSFATNMATRGAQAGRQFISRIIQSVSTLPGRIASYLSSCISRVISFASQFAQKGAQAANNFKNRILNGLKSIPSQVVNIGRQIVQGLWNGIKGAGDWLRGQISSFASSIISGFKSSFKINSPSKVMEDEVGRYLPQGIDVGIKVGSKDTLKAVKDFSNQIIETAKLANINQALSVNTGDVSTQNIVRNDSTVSAIEELRRTVEQQNKDFDYNKLKDCFVSGASNIDSTILMDKEVVGKKVATPVKTHNDRTTMRLNRLEGITQW